MRYSGRQEAKRATVGGCKARAGPVRACTHISLGSLDFAKMGSPSALQGSRESTVTSVHSPKVYIVKVMNPISSSCSPVRNSFFSSPPCSCLNCEPAMDDMAPSR